MNNAWKLKGKLLLIMALTIVAGSCAGIQKYFIDSKEQSQTCTKVVPVVGPVLEIVPPKIVATPAPKKKLPKLSKRILKYCKELDKYFAKWGWGKSRCEEFNWHHVRNSVLGRPLVWMSYGDEKEHRKKHKDMTILMCGVHGDETTAVKFCYDALYFMQKNAHLMKDKMIVIAPLTNPDSFMKRRATRTNARGVDVNRNFPTRDWKRDALRLWRKKYRKDKRRYPGKYALSEPETLFQVNLIKRYKPDKIISVHSPLTLLDYDGPADMKGKSLVASMANKLLLSMSKQARNYQIKDYPFFPGSLGNWAGNERNIPTYTLELPTSDPSKNKQYWALFKESIISAFSEDFRELIEVSLKKESASKTKPN
jgi:protein MpaA